MKGRRLCADLSGCESILPHHVAKSPSSKPLHHGEASSSDESSTSSFWSSPNSRAKSDAGNFYLPSWSANPQSPGSDRRSSPLTVPINSTATQVLNHPRRAPFLVIGFVLVGIAAVLTSKTTLTKASFQITEFESNREVLDEKLTKFERDIRALEREICAMDLMIQKLHDQDTESPPLEDIHERALSELNELQERLQDEAEQAQHLKYQVQEMSRRDIIEKYGDGVHRVEMELVFPDNHRGPTKFIIELAPTDVMPHSVHTFLEMVSTGLLNGCSFIFNAMHVLKAAPLPYDGSSASEKAKAFSEKGLESVAFKEYSEYYPHHKYTVGFAADGSPSFYINTEDNSEIHVGDPCFGKIISGFDAVERLAANPTRNGIWFERRIGIKSAQVLSD